MGKPGATVTGGNGEMVFRYEASPKSLSFAVFPLAGTSIAAARTIRFEVKTDASFALGVVLSEKKPGGANYTATIWSNAGDWQPVVLSVGDFLEGEGPNEPADSDSKLDLDQVEGVGLIDISQVFSRPSDGNSPVRMRSHMGDHSIRIRNFEISADVPPASPQRGWFSMSDARISGAAEATAIQYEQQADKPVAFLRQLTPATHKGATHIAFDVASAKGGQFVLSLTQARHHGPEGARFIVDFFVPPGDRLQHREIVLTALNRDENGPAAKNGQLNLDDLRMLTIIDISQESGTNTLSVANIRFITK